MLEGGGMYGSIAEYNTNLKVTNEDFDDGSAESDTLLAADAESVNYQDSLFHQPSYLMVSILFFLYGIPYSLLMTALPSLILCETDNDSAKSSVIYGVVYFMQYLLEFLSAPLLGSLADEKGRKPVFLMAFLLFSVTNGLLAFAPSVPMVFATAAMSGIFDAGTPTAYAIVIDIAVFRQDSLSTKFGMMGALTGLAFTIGPYLGGYLVEYSFGLTFFVSMMISLIGAAICFLCMEETVDLRLRGHKMNTKSVSLLNKLTDSEFWSLSIKSLEALEVHLSSLRMRLLLIPLFLAAMTTGLSYTLFMYMTEVLGATSTDIGLYLAFQGILNAFSQGVLMTFLIPTYLNDRQATMMAFLVSGVQRFLLALCGHIWGLNVVNTFTCASSIYLPSFKSVMVKESLKMPEAEKYQANLQGALTSVRTLAMALGSLVFPALYSLSISTDGFYFPQLAFLVSGTLFLLSFALMYVVLNIDLQDASPKETVLQIDTVISL